VLDRFHYCSDIFLALVFCLFCYTNGPIVIVANWWAKNFGVPVACEETLHEGQVWVPPFCVPFCCFGRLDGFHELVYHTPDAAMIREAQDLNIGRLVLFHYTASNPNGKEPKRLHGLIAEVCVHRCPESGEYGKDKSKNQYGVVFFSPLAEPGTVVFSVYISESDIIQWDTSPPERYRNVEEFQAEIVEKIRMDHIGIRNDLEVKSASHRPLNMPANIFVSSNNRSFDRSTSFETAKHPVVCFSGTAK